MNGGFSRLCLVGLLVVGAGGRLAAQSPDSLPARPIPVTDPASEASPHLPPGLLPQPELRTTDLGSPSTPPASGLTHLPSLQSSPMPAGPSAGAAGEPGVLQTGHVESPEHAEADAPWAFLADAEYLFMRVRTQQQDYAIVSTSNDPTRVTGTVANADWEWRSGMRVGAGFLLPGEDPWEVMFRYTYLHSANVNRAFPPDGGEVFPTLTHPGFVDVVGNAEADNSFNYNVFDLEFAKQVYATHNLQVKLFAGPRFANVLQAINATYDGGDASQDQVHSRVTFNGGGLRVGGDGLLRIVDGLGLYTRGSLSMLVGTTTATLSETNNSGASTIVNVYDRYDNVIPVAELDMGLTYQRRNFSLSAGYQLINWFGMVQGLDFVNDTQVSKISRRTGDLSIDGLVIRAEFRY
jgi:hypothetical protein